MRRLTNRPKATGRPEGLRRTAAITRAASVIAQSIVGALCALVSDRQIRSLITTTAGRLTWALFVDNPTVEIQKGPTNPFGSASAWEGQVDGFCCRFPADRGTSHAPTPFGQNRATQLCPGIPNAQVCCRFPADRGTSHAPTLSGQNQAIQLCLVFRMHRFCCRFPADRGTSHAPTPCGQNQATQLCLVFRVHRFCCRFPADRGQARSYALRAESKPPEEAVHAA